MVCVHDRVGKPVVNLAKKMYMLLEVQGVIFYNEPQNLGEPSITCSGSICTLTLLSHIQYTVLIYSYNYMYVPSYPHIPHIPHTPHTLTKQAKEKAAQQQQEQIQEQDNNYTELSNHIHSDLLTENPDIAQSAFGGHRVIPDRWKGMSPRQVEEIRAIQNMQIQEKEV